MTIIDTAMLKVEMGIPAGITFHDVALSYACDYANSYVLGRLGQTSLAAITRSEYPSIIDVGRRRVMLKKSPVVAVIAVTNSDIGVDAADYFLDPDTDEIVLVTDRSARRAGFWDTLPQGVWVTYTYGYTSTTLPARLRQATTQIASAYYLRTKHAGKSDEHNSSYSVTFSEKMIPAEAMLALASVVDVHHD